MATFSISAPGGEEYEIEAPDEASALKAYRGLSTPPAAADAAPSYGADIAKTVGPGLARGVAGTIGLPNTVMNYLDQNWFAPAAQAVVRATGRTPTSDMPGGDTRGSIASGFPSQEQILKPVEAVTGPLYKPKTIPGEVVNTLAEFAPNALFGGGSAAQRLGQVVAPALVSEGAGQAARVTAPEAEPYARFGGALVGGVGAAVAQAPRGGQVAMREGLLGVKPDELTAAQALRADARSLPEGGINIPLDEALAQITDGRTGRLSQISRVVTHSGGPGAEAMAGLYAQRPAQIDRAARGTFDLFGPLPRSPSALGLDVQDAAQAGLRQTPEGMALTQALEGAGPRVTADQAGQVIQPALRATADLREAVRAGQAARDYGRARNAPEAAGIERSVMVERPGEPIITQPEFSRPQFSADAPRPLDGMSASAPVMDGPGESLARYIARKGGINFDGGEARANDFQRWNIPGFGNVARPDGKSIDNFWREELIGAGYLKPDLDGGAARDIRDELLRKLTNEQRGVPSYPIGSEPAGPKVRAGRQSDEFRHATEFAEGTLDRDLVNAGIRPETIHPDIRSRVLGEMMRNPRIDPLDAYERVVMAQRDPLAPFVKATTVREEIPDVRFGQVNPQPALDVIGEQARFAKGDVRGALGKAERDLYEPGGADLDMSVQGFLKARERLDYQIKAAYRDGDGTKAADLQATRAALDGQLKAVPEVATADANFAANSRSLEPFTGNAPLARVAQRDDLSGRMAMPTEQVPGTLSGASAMRELIANASPTAREAQGRFWTTKILDGATDARGNVDGDKLVLAMRDNSDVLVQMPEVAERIRGIVQARNGMARVEQTPLGQLAANSDTRRAADTLFPRDPLAGSQSEIGGAMQAVARNNPVAADGITRQFMEGVFNSATRDVKGIASQYGGAGFASRVRGNAQQRQNLDAAVGALPEGAAKGTMMDRLLTALEATGYRPQKGSDTVFNADIRTILANGGGPLSAAITDATRGAAMGGAAAGPKGAAGGALLGLKRGVSDGLLRHRISRGSEDIARMLTDSSVPTADLMAMLGSGNRGSGAQLLLTRLLAGGGSGASSGNTPARTSR